MTLCPEQMVLRIWGFWKDVSCFFDRWGVRLSFSDVDRQRWIEILNITRCAARWCGVSIVWLTLAFKSCVSLLVSPWTEVNKPARVWNDRVPMYLYMYMYPFYFDMTKLYNNIFWNHIIVYYLLVLNRNKECVEIKQDFFQAVDVFILLYESHSFANS